MSGEEIYRNFTEARGGNDLSAASDVAGEVRGSHEDIAAEIRGLAVLMESAWQGDAAGAAQRGAAPLAVEHELSAPLLGTDQDLFSRQVGSFDDARHRVVPVPPAPEKPPGMSILFAPGLLPTYQRELANHNAAAQNNVDVMTGYEGASRYNAENLPESYGSLIPDSAGIGVGTPEPNDGGSEPDRRNGGGPSSPLESSGWGAGTGSRQPAVPGDGGAGSPSPGSGPSSPQPNGHGGGTPQDTTPDAHVPPGSGPIVADSLGGRPSVPVGSGQPPFGGFAALPGGPGFGGGSGGSGGPGARGGVGVPGGPGGGSAGGRPGVGDPGPGSRTGSGPVAGGAAAEAAARGGAGARGGGVAGGVPVGGAAGRGRGGEDEEHPHKSYLEGGNPEENFGTDEVTAPPVIGVEEEED